MATIIIKGPCEDMWTREVTREAAMSEAYEVARAFRDLINEITVADGDEIIAILRRTDEDGWYRAEIGA